MIAPLRPLPVLKKPHHGAALVVVAPPVSVRSICTDAVEDCITKSAISNIAIQSGDLGALCRCVAMEAICKPVRVAIREDNHRRERGTRSHGFSVVVDDASVERQARLRALVSFAYGYLQQRQALHDAAPSLVLVQGFFV